MAHPELSKKPPSKDEPKHVASQYVKKQTGQPVAEASKDFPQAQSHKVNDGKDNAKENLQSKPPLPPR